MVIEQFDKYEEIISISVEVSPGLTDCHLSSLQYLFGNLMHHDRRHLRPDSEASIADTIRVVSCKQNRDLRITFANDYACSDRKKWTGCKAACSTPVPASREANSHRMYHQSGNAVHRGDRLIRNHVNDGFLISSDSHTPANCASANRYLPVTQSETNHHNNRHPMHASHTTAAQQEQYKRDLMTQYEIKRALFLANPPPSVLASRNREKKQNDNRRLDTKSHPMKQTPLNGSRVDRSVIGRMNLDHQRMENSFRGASSRSAREIGLHGLDFECDIGGRFSNNSRGNVRPSRGHFQNNFHRGRGSKPYWCHDDRFGKFENGGGFRGQNSFRNGDPKTRQHSGDEYIDDLTPEEIAKYKLEINMDHHRHQIQRNQSNAHYIPSKKEVGTRPNQRIRSSNVPNIPNSQNVPNQHQVSSLDSTPYFQYKCGIFSMDIGSPNSGRP
ncbi:unnamed protein product [Trichobilharzia szidati]|nr:unnamed protein product [Trichobilharzia szidati]